MYSEPQTPKNLDFSLVEISSWQDASLYSLNSAISATIPIFQRGLVWQPQQIEMLWDSLFRGFPIGSLVMCPRIADQVKKASGTSSHHLLDGQQRCDAIACGLRETFSLASHEPPPDGRILWIDLHPELDEYTTRSFLFRLTDKAHPWGYSQNDTGKPLPAWQVRDALSQIGLDTASTDYQRPSPHRMAPYQARCPLPLHWLLAAVSERSTHDEIVDQLMLGLSFKFGPPWMKPHTHQLCWPQRTLAFLKDSSATARTQRELIFTAAARALCTRIPAVLVTDEASRANQWEESEDVHGSDSNVEQLFQRLNRQGTRLDGEELAYSMIKAHWPELAAPIESLHLKRMPASRLIMIAARAALTLLHPDRKALHGPLSVSRIRRIAVDRGAEAEAISNFVTHRLQSACNTLESLLTYHPVNNPKGLLPVHLASIARLAPDLYLLILLFCDQINSKNPTKENEPTLRQAILKLSMTVHWFSPDVKKTSHSIYANISDGPLNAATLLAAIQDATSSRQLIALPTVDRIESIFMLTSQEDMAGWTWARCIDRMRETATNQDDVENLEKFIHAVIWNRELLLYAQRQYISKRFPDYDPSRRDFWAGHNRP